jgi:excinuclease UvrABC ATPase subunit
MADVERLVHLFERLVDSGNSVIVAEHDLDVVARADHVIELGPGGGSLGGEIVFAGSVAELLEVDTPTGLHLARAAGPRARGRRMPALPSA